MNRLAAGIVLLCTLVGCGLSHNASVDDLTLTIQSDQTRGEIGRPIHVTFTISRSKPGYADVDAIEADGPGSVMDIMVAADPRFPYAVWSAEQPPENLIHRLDLKPGESKTIEILWTPPPTADDIRVGIWGTLKGKNSIQQDTWIEIPIGNPIY